MASKDKQTGVHEACPPSGSVRCSVRPATPGTPKPIHGHHPPADRRLATPSPILDQVQPQLPH
ncbi:hypothetical protein BJV78DRAFT_1237286 [Lactifluus subvellereus]|nr:hypothetical protein BJV78DRAFT_1263108 [Lactifluus subvellereus]KAI0248287.1 hypothetical protein BJV78DRAFT_1237286 [Lactifluus subvellereus]